MIGKSEIVLLSGGDLILRPSWCVTRAPSISTNLISNVIVPHVRICQQYPFVPAHITKPKECKKLFLVQMPERSPSFFRRPLSTGYTHVLMRDS